MIADFHPDAGGGEHDLLLLSGYGADASLTHDGDVWTVHSASGDDRLRITGVTQLSATDYRFI